MAAGLDIANSSATISAKNTSISVTGTSTNGKAIYGIAAWDGTDVDFAGDTVNVNVQTATDRGGNLSQYSETVGIDAVGGTLRFSENTALNIHVKSTGTTTSMPTTEGDNAKPGNFTGSTPIYGMKLEGGAIVAAAFDEHFTVRMILNNDYLKDNDGNGDGTTNISLESVGSKASGVYVTNFWNNSTSGSNWGDSSANLQKLNVSISTQTGDAYGIESGYTPQEGDAEIDPNTVIFSSGETNLNVSSAEGTAYGIYASGKTTTEVTGNLTVTASGADEESSYALYADAGLLNVLGNSNTLTGNVAVKNGATFTLGNDTGSNTTLNGSFSSDASSTVTLNHASLDLAAGETFTSKGAVTAQDSEIVLNSSQKNTVSIASLSDGSKFSSGTFSFNC